MQPQEIKWDKLSFSLTPTAFMYVAHCEAGDWYPGKLEPFGNISISPAACVLNYGQGVFEGLKAYHAHDGKRILLFRPDANAKRMFSGCQRLCIPPVPEDLFLKAVVEVAKANREYVPPYRQGAPSQGALYLRPVTWGTGAMLGVAPASSFTFLVYASPVGPYFKGGVQPIKLLVSQKYYRATPGGTGAAKAIGNYAAGMLPGKLAKQAGYSEMLYLDAREGRYVEEVGAANFFCIRNNTIFTPELDGCILPGITRHSILQIAQEKLGLQVSECRLPIDEILQADEAFASGTAAVVSPIGTIAYNDKDYTIGGGAVGEYTRQIYQLLINIQHGIDDPYGWSYDIDQ